MKRSSRSDAVALFAVLGVLVASGCQITIGPGTSGEPVPDSTTSAGAGGAGGTLTPEELAAIEAIQKADPDEVARITGTAAFAAVTASNLVAVQMVDPATLDAASASQLVASVAPDAISAALGWAQSIDPSVFTAGIYPQFECIEPPHNCPLKAQCPELKAICSVTQCGNGGCATCPELFQNLVISGWCAYGCMRGSEMVGGAFALQTEWGAGQTFCFPK
jgi:hypothetical protein